MSKVGGALPSWYWPTGLPRRIPVSQQPLDRTLKRQVGRTGERPALVWPERELAYGELLGAVEACARGIQGRIGSERQVVAVAERDAGEALILLLGGLFAGKQVLLADLDASAGVLASHLEQGGVDVALTATDPGRAGDLAGVEVVPRVELGGAAEEATKSARATEPAVMLPSGGELAVHSQVSLSGMAISLAAFVPQIKELSFVCTSPLWRWETLTGVLAALLNGRPVEVGGAMELTQARGAELRSAYAIMPGEDADELLDAGRAPSLLGELVHLFVSMGSFRPRWRRRLEALLGRPVLPIWGAPEFGPAVAAHPTWFPLESHGIPLVNVRLVPLDPASGEVSIVPWEMLELAEPGVETVAAMVGYARSERTAAVRAGKVLRSHALANVDHVGTVTFHPTSEGSEL